MSIAGQQGETGFLLSAAKLALQDATVKGTASSNWQMVTACRDYYVLPCALRFAHHAHAKHDLPQQPCTARIMTHARCPMMNHDTCVIPAS